ncbi:MAG: hypothetical protein PVH99_02010 [Desulfobacteraceae bacterium]|jgi:hypothetical protein
MARDKLIKALLVVIAVLLLCNLFNERLSSLFSPEVSARDFAQQLDFRGNGVALFCSSDGKYVYAASSQAIFRSLDYGKSGSWEQVITGKK